MSKRVKTGKTSSRKELELSESESSASDFDNSDVGSVNSDLEVEDDEDELSDEEDEFDLEEEEEGNEDNETDKFAESMDKILGSRVKAHDRENPILVRSKKMAKDIDNSRLEAKARAALRAEKLRNKDKARVKNIIPEDPEEAGDAISREKQLRKTTQRGVIRLLNAINQAQRVETENAGEKREDKVMALTKDKFLDAIRGG